MTIVPAALVAERGASAERACELKRVTAALSLCTCASSERFSASTVSTRCLSSALLRVDCNSTFTSAQQSLSARRG